jgi:hypothetical protein
VAAYLRTTADEDLVLINNLSSQPQYFELVIQDRYDEKTTDLIKEKRGPDIIKGKLQVEMQAYQYSWLRVDP